MKTYNGEKAIISLTSWKARIDTVGLTIFSLLENCPGFHIVLCLSSDEFPRMMDEMPEDIRLMAENDLLEILWVQKNYKSLKKVIFTMNKYPDVPVISADDDCIYKCNYANDLYNKWKTCKNSIVRYTYRKKFMNMSQGPCTIYPPNRTSRFYERMMEFVNIGIIDGDDDASKYVISKYAIDVQCCNKPNPFVFHTTIGAMHPIQSTLKFYKECF